MPKFQKATWQKPLAFLLAIVVGVVLLGYIADIATISVSHEELIKPHASIEKCQVCHHPMDEVRPLNCTRSKCHTSDFYRKKKGETGSLLVQHIKRKDCTSCHTDHKGAEADITSFDHATAAGQCQSCHMIPEKHPADNGKDCAGCHSKESFKLL